MVQFLPRDSRESTWAQICKGLYLSQNGSHFCSSHLSAWNITLEVQPSANAHETAVNMIRIDEELRSSVGFDFALPQTVAVDLPGKSNRQMSRGHEECVFASIAGADKARPKLKAIMEFLYYLKKKNICFSCLSLLPRIFCFIHLNSILFSSSTHYSISWHRTEVEGGSAVKWCQNNTC